MGKYKFLLGEKIGMTQVFVDGKRAPVTVIKAGPCLVTGVRTKEKDGYSAIILGFKSKKDDKFKKIKEFRLKEDPRDIKIGDIFDVKVFERGEKIKVQGKRKAKGFAGVVKRHGFAGGPRTHGQKDRERAPGSIGQRWPQRVRKGLKMAGRIAPINVTVKNLEVIDILPEENLILVKGSVPGPNKNIISISSINSF